MGNVCTSLCNKGENSDGDQVTKPNQYNGQESKTSPQKTPAAENKHDSPRKPLDQLNPDQIHSGNDSDDGHNKSHNSPTKLDSNKLCVKDFEMLNVLGMGTFGKVMKVQFKDPARRTSKDPMKNFMAMKVVKKKLLSQISNAENAMVEKTILKDSKHPFICKLRYSFQDNVAQYYMMEYVPGGELFKMLQKIGKFSENATAFYAAEVYMCYESIWNLIFLWKILFVYSKTI